MGYFLPLILSLPFSKQLLVEFFDPAVSFSKVLEGIQEEFKFESKPL